MENPLDVTIIILIVSWAVGFFACDVGSTIHILLVFAAVAVTIKIIQRQRKNQY